MNLADEEVEFDLYKQSMRRLLDYIGLRGYGTSEASMPARSAAEQERIDQNLPHIRQEPKGPSIPARALDLAFPCGMEAGPSASTQPTIYLSAEETLEWKAFLAGTPVENRHEVSVRRRLSLNLWNAHTRGVCLWCWFPARVCMCARLREYRATLPGKVLNGTLNFTIMLHVEEVFRSTNTGHLAAYLLGAPLRVWGVPADNAFMVGLQATTINTSSSECTDGEGQNATCEAVCRIHNLLLYPEKGSCEIDGFIRECLRSEAGRASCVDDSGAPSAFAPTDKFHLIMLDSTWGQALSLNRHFPRCVPRVSLEIDGTYEALFSALRKRTRKSGVSTFEAVSLAVGQHLRALGLYDASSLVSRTLTGAMKEFVDTKCLLKFTKPQFARPFMGPLLE